MAANLQADALRLFLALRLCRPAWGGALLVCVGLGDAGCALALAAQAAGAAALFLEEDAALLRAASRTGCCSFTVTTLEEAIRILKNEIRQRRGVTVALRGSAGGMLAEAVRRGLQPDAIACGRTLIGEEQLAVDLLRGRGAVMLSGCGLWACEGSLVLDSVLQNGLDATWGFATDAAATLPERRSRDQFLLDEAKGVAHRNPDDPLAAIAVAWLRMAPSLLPRELERAVMHPLLRQD